MEPFVDRIPADPGRVLITPEDGTEPFYATVERADNPVVEGTLLDADTLNQLASKEEVTTTISTDIQKVNQSVSTAQTTANTRVEKADTAQTAANSAQSTADSALSKANSALGRQNISMSVSNGILRINW